MTSKVNPMTQTVECRICHKKMPFSEFLNQFPIPAEEVCFKCEKLSADGCDDCRLEYIQAHPGTGFRCLSCRNSLVPC